MYNCLGIITVLAIVFTAVRTQDNSCQRPNGSTGTCQDIRNCDPLLSIVMSSRVTNDQAQMLRDHICGWVGRTKYPKVCCPERQEPQNPESCLTPNGIEGVCVALADCPAVFQMVNEGNSMKPKTRDYINRSKCDGPVKESVCCRYPVQRGTLNRVDLSGVSSLFNEKCGTLTFADKIIGGEVTAIDDYPWMAIIEYKTTPNQLKLSCGGSLISKKYVLTAAHCVHGSAYVAIGVPTGVRLGEYDKRTGKDCVEVEEGVQDCNDEPTIIPIETIILHEEYEPKSSFKNDLALIRMTEEATYGYFIAPVCLPEVDITEGLQDGKLNLTVSGWGTTEKEDSSSIKLHLKLPFVTMSQCQTKYGRSATITNNQLCAGGERGKDSCKGDSGGPLMYINSKIVLVGVVSFGPKPCAVTGAPGVYTKVFKYMDWIKSHMRP